VNKHKPLLGCGGRGFQGVSFEGKIMKDKTNRILTFFFVVGLLTLAGIVFFCMDPDEIFKKASPTTVIMAVDAENSAVQSGPLHFDGLRLSPKVQ
jgi:hypothetical protein